MSNCECTFWHRCDYLFITDFIDLLLRTRRDAARGKTYNAGSGASVSVRELAAAVNRVTGQHKPVASTGEPRPDEVMDVVADVSRAAADLDWRPRISLDEGHRGDGERQTTVTETPPVRLAYLILASIQPSTMDICCARCAFSARSASTWRWHRSARRTRPPDRLSVEEREEAERVFYIKAAGLAELGRALLALLLLGGQCDSSVPFVRVVARSRPQAAVSSGVFRRGRTARLLYGTARPGTRAYQFCAATRPRSRRVVFRSRRLLACMDSANCTIRRKPILAAKIRAASFVCSNSMYGR